MNVFWRALALSGGAAVAVGFARFGYALILPAMRSDLALDYTAAGGLNTANAAGYLAGALLVMALVRSVGDRALFIGGLFLTTVCLLACGFTRDLGWLLGWRALAGLGAAGTFICGGVLAGQLSLRAVAVYFSGGGVGMIAAGATLPWLFAVKGDGAWFEAWVLMGLACIPLAAAAAWVAASLPARLSAVGSDRPPWPWRRCLPILAAYALFGLGYISYMTFMVAWLKQEGGALIGLARATALLWCVLGAATLAAPRLWRGLVGERLDARLMARSLACVALGATLPLVLPNVFGVLGSALLVGGSVFMVPSAVTLFVKGNMASDQRSPALAAMTVVFAAGQIVGPVFAGLLSDRFASLTVGLAASAAVLAVGSAVARRQAPLAPRPA
jgi:predicted MFS family arabinose efflux permease